MTLVSVFVAMKVVFSLTLTALFYIFVNRSEVSLSIVVGRISAFAASQLI